MQIPPKAGDMELKTLLSTFHAQFPSSRTVWLANPSLHIFNCRINKKKEDYYRNPRPMQRTNKSIIQWEDDGIVDSASSCEKSQHNYFLSNTFTAGFISWRNVTTACDFNNEATTSLRSIGIHFIDLFEENPQRRTHNSKGSIIKI